jgi:hypothetical protein
MRDGGGGVLLTARVVGVGGELLQHPKRRGPDTVPSGARSKPIKIV